MVFTSIKGIPTPVCALARNDIYFFDTLNGRVRKERARCVVISLMSPDQCFLYLGSICFFSQFLPSMNRATM